MLLPKLIQESIDYYIFREKLANVNAQYMSMYNQLFYDDPGVGGDYVYIKDPNDPLPSFFNYRNMRILYDNKIYGIRSNYSRLYKIYTYLRSYVSVLSSSYLSPPVTPITYHVGTLPLRFWYSSGNNYPRGYKDFKFW
jgi:hypothetical protein